MEDGAIVVAALGQLLEVLARFRRVVVVEFDNDCALSKLAWLFSTQLRSGQLDLPLSFQETLRKPF